MLAIELKKYKVIHGLCDVTFQALTYAVSQRATLKSCIVYYSGLAMGSGRHNRCYYYYNLQAIKNLVCHYQ